MRISDWSSDVCSSDLEEMAPTGIHSTLPSPGQFVKAARHGRAKQRQSGHQWKENRQQCPVQRNCNRQKSDNRINEPDKDEIAPPVHEILPSLAQRYLQIPNTDCAYPDLRNAPIHMRIMRSDHIALRIDRKSTRLNSSH